ncbi:MAG: glycerol-3-phosphate dehydrogenase, partial [Deltaproteobacteria bacterium]
MRVAVIGAGGWGTALASLLVTAGHHVCLWVRRPGLCERLAHERENALYLPGVPLPRALAYTSLLAQAVTDVELVVLAVPSHAMRAVTSAMAPSLQKVPLIVST